jgi:Calcineurin-like phosphoesterase
MPDQAAREHPDAVSATPAGDWLAARDPDRTPLAAGPERILVAGDWHGDTRWAQRVIRESGELLAGQEHRVILHCGDFGIWPGEAGREYIFRVSAALDQAGATLLFVDGNHEDHDRLNGELERAPLMAWGTGAPIPIGSGSRAIGAVISWLPRGHRWQWHGRTWAAAGGGVSLDRVIRREGRDWWPQEEISDEQEAAIIAGGHADVLVSHDRPSWWDPRDIARSEAHERRMQRITDALQPSHIIHGHLHRCYSRTCDFGYGPVQVTGLNCNGAPGNYGLLNLEFMTWEMP